MATESNATAQQATQVSIGGWLSGELVMGALAFIACSLFPPALRGTARIAIGCALASGLVALIAVRAGYDHGTNGLLAGFAAGMFARMILLGVGYLWSDARGGTAPALAYTFTFFALYLLTVGAEIAYVLNRQRGLARGVTP